MFSSGKADIQHVEQHNFIQAVYLTGGVSLLDVTFTATLSELFFTMYT